MARRYRATCAECGADENVEKVQGAGVAGGPPAGDVVVGVARIWHRQVACIVKTYKLLDLSSGISSVYEIDFSGNMNTNIMYVFKNFPIIYD